MFRYALLILLCFASSVLGSAITIAAMRTEAPPPPAAPEPTNTDVLVAKSIALTDETGAVRLRLQGSPIPGPDGGLVVFYDESGMPRLRAGVDVKSGAFVTLQNTGLPNPDHKRITLAVNHTTARVDVGHGELSEIVLLSGPPGQPPASLVGVLGRNGSEASLYTDPYGHATIEVKDLTTAAIFRMPEWKPLLPK